MTTSILFQEQILSPERGKILSLLDNRYKNMLKIIEKKND